MGLKAYSAIGCCGIDCGLCPRFYTDGASRCPGCGGEDFESKHPPCSMLTCCVKKHGLEVCGQCVEYPCEKYEDRKKIERDSFTSHKRMFRNHERIKEVGIEVFLAEQNERVSLLKEMLAEYNDGRSKSFFCLACALLPVEYLRAAVDEVGVSADNKNDAKTLRAVLGKYAVSSGVNLALER